MTKSRHINRPPQRWTAGELRILRREYPNVPTQKLADRLHRHISSVYRHAYLLGLKKSDEFLAGPYNGRMHKGHAERGAAYRFKKGQVPPNKGLRRPGWGPGRMKETQFRKGQIPHTWKPIGTEVINKDGYLVRKVSDVGLQRHKWLPVHRIVWMEAHGQIPRGWIVCFKAGRRTIVAKDITVDALELLTLRENMLRNSYHTNYPKEIGRLIQLRGALNRQIRRRERSLREEQDR